MIENMNSAFGWCVLQVSVVAVFGAIASLVFAKRQPFTACTVACTTVTVSALLTLLAPFPVHRWFEMGVQPTSVATAPPEKSAAGRDQFGVHTDTSVSPTTGGPMFNFAEITGFIRSFAITMDLAENHQKPFVKHTTWLLIAMAVVGCLRMIAEIVFVIRLRRTGLPITEQKLLDTLREISTKFGLTKVPEVRESRHFTDAAVAGWVTPVVILSEEWRDWKDHELQAVLAHELAHLVRRDTLWRAMTSSLLAMHYYNPAVHWLLRRLMLCQELSARFVIATRGSMSVSSVRPNSLGFGSFFRSSWAFPRTTRLAKSLRG